MFSIIIQIYLGLLLVVHSKGKRILIIKEAQNASFLNFIVLRVMHNDIVFR